MPFGLRRWRLVAHRNLGLKRLYSYRQFSTSASVTPYMPMISFGENHFQAMSSLLSSDLRPACLGDGSPRLAEAKVLVAAWRKD